jgi:hypothetical protein
VLPVNNLDQSFSLQTRGLPSRVIASCKRGDPEKSLKFIIFIFCHLGFAGLRAPRIAIVNVHNIGERKSSEKQ